METVREKWTDERLDDLKDQVVNGFDRVHLDLAEIRREMAASHRLLVQLILGTIGTVVASFLGLLGLLLSHV